MLVILLTTYAVVLFAEIAGDKLLYTTGILGTRYRPMPIVAGMITAFAAKIFVAVAIGTALTRFPRPLVAGITALSFVGVAYTLWRTPTCSENRVRDGTAARGAFVAFAAIFFSEWGDVGQITAAAMAARFEAPMLVGAGAVTAMATKGVLATFFGAGMRRWMRNRISPAVIRVGGAALLLVLAMTSVVETLMRGTTR